MDIGKESVLRELVIQYENENATVQFTKLNKCIRTYSLATPEYTQNLRLLDLPNTDLINLKPFYLAWFNNNKGYPLGKLISEKLEASEIPAIYKIVINKAKELLTNG